MILRLHRKDQELVHIDHLAGKDRRLAEAYERIADLRVTIAKQARAIDGLKADLSETRGRLVNLRAILAARNDEAGR